MANESLTEEGLSKKEEADAYLKEHRILELFDNMTAQVIYHRPEDPKQFLIDYIEALEMAKSGVIDNPSLFDKSNVQSIFGMLDPTENNFLTLNQYKEAMITLGVSDYEECPPGGDKNRISLETFMALAGQGIARATATYSPN